MKRSQDTPENDANQRPKNKRNRWTTLGTLGQSNRRVSKFASVVTLKDRPKGGQGQSRKTYRIEEEEPQQEASTSGTSQEARAAEEGWANEGFEGSGNWDTGHGVGEESGTAPDAPPKRKRNYENLVRRCVLAFLAGAYHRTGAPVQDYGMASSPTDIP